MIYDMFMKTLFYNGSIYLDYTGKKRVDWIYAENGIIKDYGVGEPPNLDFDVSIDLENRFAYPSFIDCHIHLVKYGLSLWWIDLRGVKSLEEFKERIRKGLDKDFHGWILGRGWDQDKFYEKRYPTRYDIDEVVSDKPVFLRRVCGHIAVANSKALELAGITRDTPDPEGGIIDRDENGEPTGVLRETAMELVKKVIPQPDKEDLKRATLEAMEDLFSRGVTTVHLVSAEPVEWEVLNELREEGKLKLKVRVYFDYSYLDWAINKGLKFREGDDLLRFMGIKIITDGSLGGRTAAMLDDYSDDPGNRGVLIVPFDKLYQVVNKSFSNGFQLAIHGIGDRANKTIVDVYEKVYGGEKVDGRRDRIEHASILNQEIIRKMARLGIYASVQPQFITSDTWTYDRVGEERVKYAYPLKTLSRNGIELGGGSDAPVEIPDPIYGLYAATTRGEGDGNPLARYTPEEKLTIEEALYAYTLGAAKHSFDEDIIGTLEKGKYLDMVVLDKDLFNIDLDEIRNVKIVMTIVNSEVVFKQ